ncbi:MAG: NAD(P)-binding domain-containing protein [Phycisphaeraceae bacterium]
MRETRVIIVGAGPIGLELASVLKRMAVDYLHFDAGQIGQTISWYPRQARFFSGPERIAIAGVPLQTPDQAKATREQYLAYLRGVVEQFDLEVQTYQRVKDIERQGDGFVVRTAKHDQQQIYKAQHVVLAVGDMHRPRRLDIPGEDLPHVSHYFEEPHRYFRQRLLIVGGGNSAVEAALRCHRTGARVTMSYRGTGFDENAIKYWLLPEIRSLIRHGQIGFHPCTAPTRIRPDAVTLAPSGRADCDPGFKGERDVPADAVLLMTGYEMDPLLFEKAGVELEGPNRSPKVDPGTMQTSVPGLYVAGTAAAGTQIRFRLFIENCHPHVTRIVRAVTGEAPPAGSVNEAAKTDALPES